MNICIYICINIFCLYLIICYNYYHFRYAGELLMNTTLSAHPCFRKWVGTTDNEITLFWRWLSAWKSHLADYWTTEATTSTPFFSSVMPRARMTSFSFCQHFSTWPITACYIHKDILATMYWASWAIHMLGYLVPGMAIFHFVCIIPTSL